MSANQLRTEQLAAGVPAMAADADRVPLGPPYKTRSGQWVALSDGTAEWVGTPLPAAVAGPGPELLAKIASVRAAHVPDPPPPPPLDVGLVLGALVKRSRGTPEAALSAKERAELARF